MTIKIERRQSKFKLGIQSLASKTVVYFKLRSIFIRRECLFWVLTYSEGDSSPQICNDEIPRVPVFIHHTRASRNRECEAV